MASKEWYKINAEKMRAYRKKWYGENKGKQKALVLDRKRRLRKWLWEYKKTLKCKLCPEDHPACLDFHHQTDDKLVDVANIESHGFGLKKLMAEISKCEVLCSNCHRKLHWSDKMAP